MESCHKTEKFVTLFFFSCYFMQFEIKEKNLMPAVYSLLMSDKEGSVSYLWIGLAYTLEESEDKCIKEIISNFKNNVKSFEELTSEKLFEHLNELPIDLNIRKYKRFDLENLSEELEKKYSDGICISKIDKIEEKVGSYENFIMSEIIKYQDKNLLKRHKKLFDKNQLKYISDKINENKKVKRKVRKRVAK